MNGLEIDENDLERMNAEITSIRDDKKILESEYQDILNKYDREKALYEDKIEFYKEQQVSFKSDSKDQQNKFEQTLEHVQKRNNSEKEKSEANYRTLLLTIEKYKSQLEEQSQSQRGSIEEQAVRNKELQDENRVLKDKLTESLGSMQNQNMDSSELSKKVEDMKAKES